ncbi:SMP-30/gluconolactonase/LRE family protein [Sphingomonas sp. ASY06-1R]|jgi:sugar lactone lactonase YvrE|uniref:SMP-30/gluconolactonase/LRE family protein n=1 Tax=Sphingomonas sp. ASY06-1R TaxID=3445771 RepID=UPI003FA23ABE
MRGLLIITTLLGAVAATAQTPPRTLSDIGLVGSECARYDAATDRYVVSNINGAAPGFVSVVTPDGQVEKLHWIDGLIDPFGIFVAGERLYAADGDTVRIYDRRTGAPASSVVVPGAQRLNDLAVSKDGTIYVTDSGKADQPGAIYRISRNGKVVQWAPRNDAMERPNGIAVTSDGMIVHGGRGVNLVFRNAAGKIVRERSLPAGRIDGIVAMDDGGLLVASQDGHVVYHVGANNGAITVVAKDIEVPAAIGYDSKRHRLIVPQIRAASLTLVDLPPR